MISSIILPPTPRITPVGAPVPAGLTPTPRTYTQTASGLYLPSAMPTRAAAQLVIAPKSLVDDLSAPNVLAYARAGHAQLSRSEGSRFADFRIGDQLGLVDRIAAIERQRAVVEGFLRNRVEYGGGTPRASASR